MRGKNAQPWNRDPTPGVAVVATGVALAAFLALTGALLFLPEFREFDERLSAQLREFATPGLDTVARWVTDIGSGVVMTALTAAGALWLLLIGRRPEAVLLVAVMALGSASGAALQDLIERARPGLDAARIPIPDRYSFPSLHALASMLFFGIVAFLVFVMAPSVRVKIWGALACVIVALAVALSRVYLGVHFFGDIMASWMLGSAILIVAIACYAGWVTRKPAE